MTDTMNRIKAIVDDIGALCDLPDGQEPSFDVDKAVQECMRLSDTLNRKEKIEAMNYIARLYNGINEKNGATHVEKLPIFNMH